MRYLTTTLWTLPANLGISVNPRFDYSAIEVLSPGFSRNPPPEGGTPNEDEVLIIASELVESVAEKAGFDGTKELVRFKGDKLDNLEAQHPWIDRVSLIMLGDHVTLGDDSTDENARKTAGTGLSTPLRHGTDDSLYRPASRPAAYCPSMPKAFSPMMSNILRRICSKANRRSSLGKKERYFFTKIIRIVIRTLAFESSSIDTAMVYRDGQPGR